MTIIFYFDLIFLVMIVLKTKSIAHDDGHFLVMIIFFF
jgi:hypothetical protein